MRSGAFVQMYTGNQLANIKDEGCLSNSLIIFG